MLLFVSQSLETANTAHSQMVTPLLTSKEKVGAQMHYSSIESLLIVVIAMLAMQRAPLSRQVHVPIFLQVYATLGTVSADVDHLSGHPRKV